MKTIKKYGSSEEQSYNPSLRNFAQEVSDTITTLRIKLDI
jgi:hypothetical protein